MEQKSTVKHSKKLLQGALILSLAGIIVKILSAVYRVPFQNLVGNTGFYVYQQVYPLYGIGMTFALSGFPVFMSHLIAQEHDVTKRKVLLQKSFVILSGIGLVCFSGLMFGANFLALVMGDTELTPVIQMVSWMFLCMPFLVISRGYFQGNFSVGPTAISQIMEQVVRITVILIVAFIYSQGLLSLYDMGKWSMLSASIAAVFASIILYWYMYSEWKQTDKRFIQDMLTMESVQSISFGDLIKRFITEGGTICLVSSMLVLFQLIDSFTVFKTLVSQNQDIPELAKSMKGVYDRGQPLVQLGMVIGIGFTSSYLPLLAKSYLKENQLDFRRSAKSLIKMTSILALMATVGMIAILPRLNHVLFSDTLGNITISIYIGSVWLASLIMAHNGILQSMSLYKITLFSLMVGLVVKCSLNLTLIKQYSLAGASMATVSGLVVMYLTMVCLSPRYVRLMVKEVFTKNHIVTIAVVVFCSVFISDVIVQTWVPHEVTRLGDFVIILGEVTIGVLVFLMMALQKQIFTTREWLMMPKGKEFLRFIKNSTNKN